MERLTQKSINYCAEICRAQDCETYHGVRNDVCGDAAIYNRLAAYEDTGMEPKEVKAKCAWADNVCKMLSGMFEDSGVFDFSHIKELITAEQQGRLVVLPCKVGDTVFVIKDTDSFAETVVPVIVAAIRVTRGKDPIVHFGGTYPFKWAYSSELGKSFYLTREEAEAAMKGGSEDTRKN